MEVDKSQVELSIQEGDITCHTVTLPGRSMGCSILQKGKMCQFRPVKPRGVE